MVSIKIENFSLHYVQPINVDRIEWKNWKEPCDCCTKASNVFSEQLHASISVAESVLNTDYRNEFLNEVKNRKIPMFLKFSYFNLFIINW